MALDGVAVACRYCQAFIVASGPHGIGQTVVLSGFYCKWWSDEPVVGGIVGAIAVDCATVVAVVGIFEVGAIHPASPVVLGVEVFVGIDDGEQVEFRLGVETEFAG